MKIEMISFGFGMHLNEMFFENLRNERIFIEARHTAKSVVMSVYLKLIKMRTIRRNHHVGSLNHVIRSVIAFANVPISIGNDEERPFYEDCIANEVREIHLLAAWFASSLFFPVKWHLIDI